MPLLTVTKGYADSTTVSLTDANLDSIATSIEDFLNLSAGGGIDDLNIQDGGITASSKLKDANITTAKIADNAVTDAKLAALGQQLSASTSTYTTTSTSFVDVTNATATITTTGNPVMMFLQPDGTSAGTIGGTTGQVEFKFVRDSTDLGILGYLPNAATATNGMPGLVNYVDIVTAGTYVYKLQAKTASGTLSVTNCKLVVLELR